MGHGQRVPEGPGSRDLHRQVAEEAHDVLRYHLLVEHHDEGPSTVRSTKDLNTVQTEEYYARARQVIAEWFGVYVPLPNEVPEQ